MTYKTTALDRSANCPCMPSVRFELTSREAAVFETAMYTIPSQGPYITNIYHQVLLVKVYALGGI